MTTPTQFKAILLPVDIWEVAGSLKHLSCAVGLALSCSCPIHALTVLPDAEAIRRFAYSVVTFEEAVSKVEDELDTLLKRAIPGEVKWTRAVVRGEVYKEILRAEKERGIDLIVMAAHRPRLSDFLIGSNAEKVARHAKGSVLLVRD